MEVRLGDRRIGNRASRPGGTPSCREHRAARGRGRREGEKASRLDHLPNGQLYAGSQTHGCRVFDVQHASRLSVDRLRGSVNRERTHRHDAALRWVHVKNRV